MHTRSELVFEKNRSDCKSGLVWEYQDTGKWNKVGARMSNSETFQVNMGVVKLAVDHDKLITPRNC